MPSTGQFYGTEGWNPKIIGFRILLLQTTFYTIVSFLMICMSAVLTGSPYSTNLLFDCRALDFSFGAGYIPIVSYILATFPISFVISCIVKRAKKCLDYVFTLYAIHFILCWIMVSFPNKWDWWLVNICAFLIMAFLSEYLCIRQEMKNIQFGNITGAIGKKNKAKIKNSTKNGMQSVNDNNNNTNLSNNNNNLSNNNNGNPNKKLFKLRTSDPKPINMNEYDIDDSSLLINSHDMINDNMESKSNDMIDNMNINIMNKGNDRALHSDTSDMEIKNNDNNMNNLDNDAQGGSFISGLTGLIRNGTASLSRLRNGTKEDMLNANDDEIIPLTSDNVDIKIV